MKKYVRDVQDYIEKSFVGVKSMLFYGEDMGLVSELFENSSRAVAPDLSDTWTVFDFTPDELNSNPALLLDEVQSMTLMGGRKLIRIKWAVNKNSEILKDAMGRFSAENVFIVVSAGELDASSSLRKLYDGSKTDLVSVACYLEDGTTIPGMKGIFQKAGYKIGNDVLNYLKDNLGQDKLSTLSELNKLMTYVGAKKEINLEDAMKCVGDSSALNVQDLSFALTELDAKKASILLQRLIEEGESVVMLVRFLQMHFRKIYGICASIESGLDVDSALQSNGIIFWKIKPLYKNNIWRWNTGKVQLVFDKLQQLDIKLKEGGGNNQPEYLVFSHFILEFCTIFKK